MILLPCEVDFLMEEFGIVDSALTISNNFNSTVIIADDGSIGSDCFVESSQQHHAIDHTKEVPKHNSPYNNTSNHNNHNNNAVITEKILPDISSIKSSKSSKSGDHSRNKQTSEKEGQQNDVPILVLPRIQQQIMADSSIDIFSGDDKHADANADVEEHRYLYQEGQFEEVDDDENGEEYDDDDDHYDDEEEFYEEDGNTDEEGEVHDTGIQEQQRQQTSRE